MNSRFIEQLENRQFLSADVIGCEPDLLAAYGPQSAVLQRVVQSQRVYSAAARAKIPSIVGTYRGTAKTPYGKQAITLRITKQQSDGRFTGLLTHPNHSWVSLKVVGTVKSNRSVSFTFSGKDTDGSATGSGSATVSADGKSIAGKFTETEAGTRFGGTLSVRR